MVTGVGTGEDVGSYGDGGVAYPWSGARSVLDLAGMRAGDAGPAIRTALLTIDDPNQQSSWSGTPRSMMAALGRWLGPVRTIGPLPRWPKRIEQVGRAVLPQHVLPGHGVAASSIQGRSADRRLREQATGCDVVVAIAASTILPELRTELPVVYASDATVATMVDYYPRFTGLASHVVRRLHAQEAAAIGRADLLVYPTRWAADSAIRDYGADPDRIVVAPYGANMAMPDDPRTTPRATSPFRLLLVGVDWFVKGVDVAVDAARLLRQRGVDVHLTVVGCTPPAPVTEPNVEIIGFLDKADEDDAQRMESLYRNADAMLLPSRCECFGIVLCEAAGYGVPAVARATGGIPEVVVDGETGVLVPQDGDAVAWADAIERLASDLTFEQRLREGAAAASRDRLDWDAWGSTVAEAIRATVADTGSMAGDAG